ncbi:MAG: MBL fold metallo-hydrolase [Planctomycetota bacterium]|nr:MBL fold metallo-hydrolase [Planctomycetota bacterium]
MEDARPRLEALGVAGSPAPERLTTCFRLSGGIAIDAGALAHAVAPDDFAWLKSLVLTHAHLDHTLGIPFVLGRRELTIWGLQETLDAVRESLLDGRIWPDLSDRARWIDIDPGATYDINGWEVETGPAVHTIPCLSYSFRRGDSHFVCVGDTRHDPDVVAWVAERRPPLCIVECSYPNEDAGMAQRFGHQTPQDLAKWRAALGEATKMLVTHLKPSHEKQTRHECASLGDPGLVLMAAGDVFDL